MSLQYVQSVQLVGHAIKLQRGHRVLVEDVSIILQPGDGLMLRGANGSGKTTLLRALAGFHQIAAGRIEWKIGHQPDLDFEFQHCISYMGHLDAIKLGLPVITQLEFWADIEGITRAAIGPALERVGLVGQRNLPGGALSAGQRRRLALARLLIQARPIWLLDEPAAPLDGEGRALLGHLLDDHRQRGGFFVAAVHDDLPGQSVQQLWLSTQSEPVQ